MNEKYKISQFGHASFAIKKKSVPITYFNGYGTITDVDDKNVEFTDNDGYVFIVSKYRFTFIDEQFVENFICN